MTDFAAACRSANEQMKSPPRVENKLAALDGLDRLALNPNAWFTEPLLDKLTAARAAIIQNRWNDAVVTLNEAANAMDEFIAVVAKGPEKAAELHRDAALALARAELGQCALVQEFVGKKSAGLL